LSYKGRQVVIGFQALLALPNDLINFSHYLVNIIDADMQLVVVSIAPSIWI
jgi:hypothetical protein